MRNPVGTCDACDKEQVGIAVHYRWEHQGRCQFCGKKDSVIQKALGPGNVQNVCYSCVEWAISHMFNVQK